MITGKGIGFVIAAIALFLLGRLTQVGWLYLVDSVLWGIILLSAIFPWLGVAFITAHRKVETPNPAPGSGANGPSASPVSSGNPKEGDSVRITVSLSSRAFWPSYLLNVFYDCPVAPPSGRLHRFFVSNVFRSGQVSMETNIEAHQRGLHHLGPVVIESTAPFGLFRRRHNLTEPQAVLVYPQVHPLRRLAMAQSFSGMEAQGRKARTGTDPMGARKYAPGDPRRIIHWRNSAKSGQLMVKELEDPLDRTTYLIFDAIRVWGEGRETSLEYAIKVAASVASFAQRSSLSVQVLGGGITGNQSTEANGQGRSALPALMKELALVKTGDGAAFAEQLAKLPPGASVVAVISPADRVAVQALAKASPSLRTVLLVSLEGFGAPEINPEDWKTLQDAKITVVPCRPGQLRQALDALGNGTQGGKVRTSAPVRATPNAVEASTVQDGDGQLHG